MKSVYTNLENAIKDNNEYKPVLIRRKCVLLFFDGKDEAKILSVIKESDIGEHAKNQTIKHIKYLIEKYNI